MTDHLTDPHMTPDLRALAARVAAGEDPDAIRGIEKLWLYRMHRDKEKIEARESSFFKELRRLADKKLGASE